MTEQVKKKVVKVKEYVAKDGNVFDNKDDCVLYEKKLDGEIIDCPECKGTGKVHVTEEYDDYHTGELRTATYYITCAKCNGKGYLEKKIVYE